MTSLGGKWCKMRRWRYKTMTAAARSMPIPPHRYDAMKSVRQYVVRPCSRRSLHSVDPTAASVMRGTGAGGRGRVRQDGVWRKEGREAGHAPMGRSQAAVMVSAACWCCVNMTNGTPNAVKIDMAACVRASEGGKRGGQRRRTRAKKRREERGGGGRRRPRCGRTDRDPVQDERDVERVEAVLVPSRGNARHDRDKAHGCARRCRPSETRTEPEEGARTHVCNRGRASASRAGAWRQRCAGTARSGQW